MTVGLAWYNKVIPAPQTGILHICVMDQTGGLRSDNADYYDCHMVGESVFQNCYSNFLLMVRLVMVCTAVKISLMWQPHGLLPAQCQPVLLRIITIVFQISLWYLTCWDSGFFAAVIIQLIVIWMWHYACCECIMCCCW